VCSSDLTIQGFSILAIWYTVYSLPTYYRQSIICVNLKIGKLKFSPFKNLGNESAGGVDGHFQKYDDIVS
jgi:hypothetical protein